MQDKREISAIVNEKIMRIDNCDKVKSVNFHTFGGGTSLAMALASRQTYLHALKNFSSLIDKVSLKTACL